MTQPVTSVRKQQPRTAVRRGSDPDSTIDITLPTGRHPGAVAAVIEWHRTHPSLFWCGNPFELEPGSPYRGGFAHTYYDEHGKLQVIRVSYKGSKVEHAGSADGAAPLPGLAEMLERAGVFAGGDTASPLWEAVKEEPDEPLDPDAISIQAAEPSVPAEEDRGRTLLEAARRFALLHPETTIHYDEADCDGQCLADDIASFLSHGA